MELLERHDQLAELQTALTSAATGHGVMALVTGEAGAGKTSLIREFGASRSRHARFLWGVCDELVTPRPLGPFRDIAAQLADDTHAPEFSLTLDTPSGILEQLTRRLGSSGNEERPAVVVVEDVHWADEATIDTVRILARRVAHMPVVLVVTCRSEEAPADHPFWSALGTVPADDVRRIQVPPLSVRAVAQLAGRSDVQDLYRLTNGNPFYVRELLTSRGDDVPRTVQDSVVARVSRLPSGTRACVETAAIVPGRAEAAILRHCGLAEWIDDANQKGLVQTVNGVVTFSHELVRQAIENSLAPARRRALNRRVLGILEQMSVEPARLAHHAVQAADSQAVIRHAPAAARHAAELDSHREAVAHYEHALPHLSTLPDRAAADLLREYAHECATTQQQAQAVDALNQAIDLYRGVQGAQEVIGLCMVDLSEAHWYLGDGARATATAQRARTILEQQPQSAALAAAYAQQAKLAMVDLRPNDALTLGRKALELADRHNDLAVRIHALNTVGTSQWNVPPYDRSPLFHSLELALASNKHKAAGRAYNNLADGHVCSLELDQAWTRIGEGLAHASTHDLQTVRAGLLTSRATWHFLKGQWTPAARDANDVLESLGDQTAAMIVLTHISVRLGKPDAAGLLDAAERLAHISGDAQYALPLGLVQLEHLWLGGDFAAMEPLAIKVHRMALRTGSPRWIGESALWMHRAGRMDDAPAQAAAPYALQIMGSWEAAAASWHDLGCPYNEADALACSLEPEPLLQALRTVHQLGARPRADMVRRQLADMGVTRIPRGPRPAAQSNPAGLTPRQTDIVRLLAAGLTYREIAQKLHLSVKTVDHHVSAVRSKLNVSSRAEAVMAARALGLVPATP